MLLFATDNLFYPRLQTNTWQAKQPGFFQYIAFNSLSKPLNNPCTVWAWVQDSSVVGWRMRSKLHWKAGCWVTGCPSFTAPVQRLVVFVLLLAWGQNSGRHSLFKAVTLVLRTDKQLGGFSLFVQFVQQSLTKTRLWKHYFNLLTYWKWGKIFRIKIISCLSVW